VGFDKESGKFDLVLLAGRKIRDRLLAAGQLRNGHYALCGYPKFDAVSLLPREPLNLFDNDRPTVLYNPHCSSELSSWYRFGPAILEYFYQSTRYNLIFAPHIMLFEKKLQASLHSWRVRRPGTIPRKYQECGHIHIDTGSRMSTDMSYTLAADLYLGDVSSQVYEFLIKPRPCVFANPGAEAWQNDPNYLCWQYGPVFDRIDQLDKALDRGFNTHADYLQVQQRNFAYSFDMKNGEAAPRAVRAIVAYMEHATAHAVTAPGRVQTATGNMSFRTS
jgi:CDP-glycerol glycerophosphotransferase (TagB/SpsB family)